MAIDYCLQQIKAEGIVNVRGFVSKMREQRNHMVQTEVRSNSACVMDRPLIFSPTFSLLTLIPSPSVTLPHSTLIPSPSVILLHSTHIPSPSVTLPHSTHTPHPLSPSLTPLSPPHPLSPSLTSLSPPHPLSPSPLSLSHTLSNNTHSSTMPFWRPLHMGTHPSPCLTSPQATSS